MNPDISARGLSNGSVTVGKTWLVLSKTSRIRIYLLILLLASTIGYGMSESVGYGDAPYYALQIEQGILIEPGHLLWRPLGAALYAVIHQIGYTGDALWVLQGISLVASVASVAAMFYFLLQWCAPATAFFGAALFAFSNGFWYYGISGCSYSLSVFFTIMAVIFAAPAKDTIRPSPKRTLLSGLMGGMAALAWLPQGLNMPALLAANILLQVPLREFRIKRAVMVGMLFLAAYAGTVWLPLVGAYLALPLLGAYHYYGDGLENVNFVGWLISASHNIHNDLGLAQGFRVINGWAQSIVNLNDLGSQVRLWLIEGKGSLGSSVAAGLLKLSFFYFVVMAALWLILKNSRRGLLGDRKTAILVVGFGSLLANFAFSLGWEATALERYLPSTPFLILALCIAWDTSKLSQRPAYGILAALIIPLVITVNWLGTFAPVQGADSYRHQWLTAVHRHMTQSDLLIILGSKHLADPHNRAMPRILHISLQTTLTSDPATWKGLTQDWIRQTLQGGGRVLIGESVLGLDPMPRGGWSFKEHPVPSPKDLDDFFGPLKGQFVFSAGGERVWLMKSDGAEKP